MRQPTAPLAAATAQPTRSSWPLRGLFTLLVIGLIISGGAVATLVGYTVLSLVEGGGSGASTFSGPESLQPIERQAPFVESADNLDSKGVDVWDRHGPINILLLGVDVDDCSQPDGLMRRTDTIILVRIDPQSGKAAMLSIPRDLYVYIDGHEFGGLVGSRKINTAHVFGTRFDENQEVIPHSGPNLVKETIQSNLGIAAHRYMRIDFEGFKQIVEALDGIEVDVQPNSVDPTIGLYDSEYPDGRCGTMTVQFPPGNQSLGGAEALQYARSRKSTSDFDRSRRQMEVLMAIKDKGTSLGVVLDLPKLLPAIMDTVDTDLTANEIFSLARIARKIETEDIVRMRLDENAVYNDLLMIDNVPQWVLRLQPQRFEALRTMFLTPELAITATQEAAAAEQDGASAPTP